MTLRFASLGASSKGNCWIVDHQGALLLIDLGVSIKKIAQFLALHHYQFEQVVGVCISHEHSDHAKSVVSFQRETGLPLHCNFYTAEALCKSYHHQLSCAIFSNFEPFRLGPFEITPFSVPHDAMDPVGFRISCGQDLDLALCTDLGYVHKEVTRYLKGLRALVIESNHDLKLVEQSQRPDRYKERVISRVGHLSNRDCSCLLEEVYHPKLEQVLLSHLSEDCNDPQLALSEAQKTLKRVAAPHTPPKLQLAPLVGESGWITLEAHHLALG